MTTGRTRRRRTGLEDFIPRSVYQTDFHGWRDIPREHIRIRPVAKGKERSKNRPEQKDLETMRPFKPNSNLPFSLLHRKKLICQVDPHDPIPDIKLEDKMFESKLKARRRRPSVYMVPQINLDDVPEDVMYGEKGKSGLAGSIYSSNWTKASDFTIQNSPLKVQGKKTEDVVFEKKDIIDRVIEKTTCKAPSVVPPLEIGLAKYIDEWEKQNPVEFVDTTKIFWDKHPDIALCSICDPQPAAKGLTEEESKELESCLKEEALRTPFTLHPPGYTGYVPRLAVGIPFRRKLFTKYDTFLSTLMEAQGVYKK